MTTSNDASSVAADAEGWTDLGERIAEMSGSGTAFYLLVALSTTIAGFGLLANSTAVIIGAMLVAPLMGPIFGVAFALATGRHDLLARAAGAELRGMALAVALGALIGMVSPHADFGAEILSRTRPTVYDIIVAVASGLAGAFALTDRRVSPALPGVAIATAIVPPLATVGLCLSAGHYDQAGGAFLLFFANLVAIEITAVVWFTALGMRTGHLHENFRLGFFLQHFGISAILLLAIGAFMTRTLTREVTEERRRARISAVLRDEIRITQGARLGELTINRLDGDTLDVLAEVLTPQEFLPEQVARLERQLDAALRHPVRLIVRSIISRDADRDGPVYVDADEAARKDAAAQQTVFLDRASALLRRRFATTPGVELEELRRDRQDSVNLVTVVVRTPAALAPSQVDSLQRQLTDSLAQPIHLVVRSVLTRDADASGYLYDSALVPDSLADTVASAPRARVVHPPAPASASRRRRR